jgi:hypothetical protein
MMYYAMPGGASSSKILRATFTISLTGRTRIASAQIQEFTPAPDPLTGGCSSSGQLYQAWVTLSSPLAAAFPVILRIAAYARAPLY